MSWKKTQRSLEIEKAKGVERLILNFALKGNQPSTEANLQTVSLVGSTVILQ